MRCCLLTGGFFFPAQRQIYSDVFARWPKQELRPDYQFQDVLRKTVEARYENLTPVQESEEVLKARALQFLLRDKFKDRVRWRHFATELVNADTE